MWTDKNRNIGLQRSVNFMSTYNLEDAAAKLPASIENMVDLVSKLQQTGDYLVELANETGAQQFINDAKAAKQTTDGLAEQIKAFVGEEGDSATGVGTLWGSYGAVKRMNKAFNGEE